MSFRCQALAEALKVNRSITHIDLRENQIEDAGAQAMNQSLLDPFLSMSFRCQALAEALKVNRSITHIDLCDNQIGQVGVEASPGCQAPCPDRERSWAPFAPGAGRGGAGERRHPQDRP